MLRQSEHLEIVDEVRGIEVAPIADIGILPNVIVVKDILELPIPLLDGGPLRSADCVSVGIFEVDEGIVLPGNVIAGSGNVW